MGSEPPNNNDNDSVSCSLSILSEQRHIINSYHDIDEELAEILQLSKMDSEDELQYWSGQTDPHADYSVTTVPSPTQSSTECLSSPSSGLPGDTNSVLDTSRPSSSVETSNRSVETASVSTQTISTGDIMAVQVYLENSAA